MTAIFSTNLGEDKYRQINRLLKNKKSVTQIAKQVGCGTSTVYRVKRVLDRDAA